MHWRFIDWSSFWLKPSWVMLGIGFGVAFVINTPVAYLWHEYRTENVQQKEREQQFVDMSKLKLIKQLEGYRDPSQNNGAIDGEMSLAYPEFFSTSEFYTYISSILPAQIEITAWKWRVEQGRYLLTVGLKGPFERVKKFVSLALGYAKTSRLESVKIELGEQGLIAELQLGFYVREIENAH